MILISSEPQKARRAADRAEARNSLRSGSFPVTMMRLVAPVRRWDSIRAAIARAATVFCWRGWGLLERMLCRCSRGFYLEQVQMYSFRLGKCNDRNRRMFTPGQRWLLFEFSEAEEVVQVGIDFEIRGKNLYMD